MSSFLMNLNLNTPKQQQRLERLKKEKKERERFEKCNAELAKQFEICSRNYFLTHDEMRKKSVEMVKRLNLNMREDEHYCWNVEYEDLQSKIKRVTHDEIKTYILKEDENLCYCGVIGKKSECHNGNCIECHIKFLSTYNGTWR